MEVAMAATTVVRFSATVQDDTGLKASTITHLYVDAGQTVTQVVTALNAWLAALDAITGGRIIRSSASIVPALAGGIKGTAVAGSEVQEVASFDYTQVGVATHWASIVPSFLETLETADHKPDLAAVPVAAYNTLLTTAPVLGGFYSGLGIQQLNALSYAFLPTRKHRRGERAISLVEA
jgi:hypothetical protein